MRASLLFASLCLACSTTPDAPPPPPPPPPADVPAIDAPPTVTDRPATPVDGPRDGGGAAACGLAFGPTCNLVSNAGCGAGQGCYIQNTIVGNRARCTVAGGSGWGDPCTAQTDCREGFICLASTGGCTKLCCENDDSSCRDRARGGRDGARCAGNFSDLMGLRFCLEDTGCDPFATGRNGCPAEAPRCNPIGDATTCSRAGMNCGAAAEGSPCCNSNCCPNGHVCVITGGGTCNPAMPNGVCRRTCNARGATPDAMCPSGQRCQIGFNPESRLPSYFRACAP